jgi:hypothetical protein
MRTLKHLPVNEWPEADREAFRAAYEPGDVFDETAGRALTSQNDRQRSLLSAVAWLSQGKLS